MIKTSEQDNWWAISTKYQVSGGGHTRRDALDCLKLSLHSTLNAIRRSKDTCTCGAKPEHMGGGRYGKWHSYSCPMFDGDHPEICTKGDI